MSWCNRVATDGRVCLDPAHRSCGDECLVRELVTNAFQSGSEVEVERFVTVPDGRRALLNGRSVPLRDGGGAVEMVLVIVHDVTTTRAMEVEVLHATKMAVLGRVAAGMAHEIGNPLASMNVRLALLRQSATGEFERESAVLLQQHVERIHRLVQSVRRFGRRSAAEARSVAVNELVMDVQRMLRHDPRGRGVNFQCDLAPDLPPIRVVADQLTQVVLNLCLNAFEAMPGGGQINVATRAEDAAVVLTVTDSGEGLSSAVQDNLFRPFFTTKPEGTGLGLFLSQRMVCDMGGTIDVAPAEGRGTCFIVRIPVAGTGAAVRSGLEESKA